MKTVDDYLNDLDQDLADATKAFRQAERLLWRGRRRLVALMGAARALGLRSDDLPFIPDREFAAAVADQHLKQAGQVHYSVVAVGKDGKEQPMPPAIGLDWRDHQPAARRKPVRTFPEKRRGKKKGD